MDLKRRSPFLGTKEDENLFYDKERVAKKPKREAPYVHFRGAWLPITNMHHSCFPSYYERETTSYPGPALTQIW